MEPGNVLVPLLEDSDPGVGDPHLALVNQDPGHPSIIYLPLETRMMLGFPCSPESLNLLYEL